MTLRKYLISLFASTVFCWASFALIVLYINPETSGIVGQVCFFLGLFFALVGTATLMGFYGRVWFSKNEVLFAHIGPSFRQAALFSLMIVGCLILQSLRLLTWWDALLLAATFSLVEFYFLTK